MSMTSLFISLAASGGKNFMIVGCNGGVYVGIRGEQGKSRPFDGNEVDMNYFKRQYTDASLTSAMQLQSSLSKSIIKYSFTLTNHSSRTLLI